MIDRSDDPPWTPTADGAEQEWYGGISARATGKVWVVTPPANAPVPLRPRRGRAGSHAKARRAASDVARLMFQALTARAVES